MVGMSLYADINIIDMLSLVMGNEIVRSANKRLDPVKNSA